MHKYLVFLLFLVCCKSAEPSAAPEAVGYIDEVLAIMQANSVNRNTIDWKAFREKVLKKAAGATTDEDAYPAIHYAVTLLGDGHSYFAPAIDTTSTDNGDNGEPPMLKDEVVPSDIGYVRVRYCMGDTHDTLNQQKFANALLDDIKRQDKAGLKGWVVDLRGNFGGNMSPMLQGVGPLLGEGIPGYFMSADGVAHPFEYTSGSKAGYRLKEQNPYVAVLTDTLTASSGELVAIAFKGREKTRSFGYSTYGVSTGNERFDLSDGSRLLLTVSKAADRNRKVYGRKVHPDKVVHPDKALDEAVNWLNEQNKK